MTRFPKIDYKNVPYLNIRSNIIFPEINKKTLIKKTKESRKKINNLKNQTKLFKIEKDFKKNHKKGVLPIFYKELKENLNKKTEYSKMIESIKKKNLLKEFFKKKNFG